ncbi:probable methyltransferase [Tanacetum coccineum]|uniref:Probable methyltransferase n=1 Tax=Tanacetum coccineum TaxID=301880 RepID=A0ABQ5HTI2_9ASTR
MKNNRGSRPDGRFFIIICVAAVIGGIFLLPSFIGIGDRTPLFCSESISEEFYPSTTTPLQLDAILHYATSQVVPQQTVAEIMVSFDVLAEKAPCNFLIFGLRYDSLMWAAFNPKERHCIVNYQTKLEDADKLMKSYRSEPECAKSYIQGGPRENGGDLLGCVMARNRKKPGVTHVFLHDVDRKVEKTYAEEFLCRKNLKKAVRRLWHFEIPPAENVTTENARFC